MTPRNDTARHVAGQGPVPGWTGDPIGAKQKHIRKLKLVQCSQLVGWHVVFDSGPEVWKTFCTSRSLEDINGLAI